MTSNHDSFSTRFIPPNRSLCCFSPEKKNGLKPQLVYQPSSPSKIKILCFRILLSMAGGQVAIPLQISGLEAKPKLINATTSLLKLYIRSLVDLKDLYPQC